MYSTSFSLCAVRGSLRMTVTAPSAGIQDRIAQQSSGISAGLQEGKAWEEFLWALSNKYIYLFQSETKK